MRREAKSDSLENTHEVVEQAHSPSCCCGLHSIIVLRLLSVCVLCIFASFRATRVAASPGPSTPKSPVYLVCQFAQGGTKRVMIQHPVMQKPRHPT